MYKDVVNNIISNKDFITSLESISFKISKKIYPIILSTDSEESFTDLGKIVIGIPSFFYLNEYEPWDLVCYIKGITFHESEHIVSSNFKVLENYNELVRNYYLPLRGEVYTDLVVKVGQYINNSLEDGRIELIHSIKFPVHTKILKYVHSLYFRNQMVNEFSDDPLKNISDFLLGFAYMASICRTPQNWDFTYSDKEEGILLELLKDDIIKAQTCESHESLSVIAFDILKKVELYIYRKLKNSDKLASPKFCDTLKEFIDDSFMFNSPLFDICNGDKFSLSVESKEMYDNIPFNYNNFRENLKSNYETDLNERDKINKARKNIMAYTERKINIDDKELVVTKFTGDGIYPFVYDTEIHYLKKEFSKLFDDSKESARNKKSGILDCNSLWKTKIGTNDIFKKLSHHSEYDMALSILIDSSGSMEGIPIKFAHKTCSILETLFSYIINLQIVYFNCSSSYNHIIVKDFEQHSKGISLNYIYEPIAKGSNKESVHLNYAINELKARSEKNKIILILSDGLPSEYNSMEEGIKEVYQVVHDNKDIKIICIAIGKSYHELVPRKELYDKMYDNLILTYEDQIYANIIMLLKKLLF